MSLEAWSDALAAAAILAVDPFGVGGVSVRARAGPVRAHWCDTVRSLLPGHAPLRRVPPHVTEDRLLGGLDLAATLKSRRLVAERGILASADGGLVVIPMSERLVGLVATHVATALDLGEVVIERDGIQSRQPARFGVIALDEGIDDERVPKVLFDRLGPHLDLDEIPPRWTEDIEVPYRGDQVVSARARLPQVEPSAQVIEALCEVSARVGIASLRAPIRALAVARAAAALDAREHVVEEDVLLAARLVLAPRATRLPEPQQEPESEPPPPDEKGETLEAEATSAVQRLEDRVLEAVASVMPEGLLATLADQRRRNQGPQTSGPSGVARVSGHRGRRWGVRPGALTSGARLNVVETLRASAPWQRLRRSEDSNSERRVEVRAQDFRITRFRERTQTLTIFLVDASGSAALQRLAEAKGAVERLLAECYARRDHVALIAFRGKVATLLLPPTRSLARAKRSLAGLPGGGTTPLATGIDAAKLMAEDARRRGQTPVVVLMTDGRANVARDGAEGRARAGADALDAARRLGRDEIRALFVDTARRPSPEAQALADAMRARYLPLPRTDGAGLTQMILRRVESR